MIINAILWAAMIGSSLALAVTEYSRNGKLQLDRKVSGSFIIQTESAILLQIK
jgi:hypothetical protein